MSEGATPMQPWVCCLHIHLGKDTQRWHSLSTQCYKPGDLSATTRHAVNWVCFMEPVGDYLKLSAAQCLCTMLKIYLNNYVLPILWIRLNNGLQSAWIVHVSFQRDIWSWVLRDSRAHETNTRTYSQSHKYTREAQPNITSQTDLFSMVTLLAACVLFVHWHFCICCSVLMLCRSVLRCNTSPWQLTLQIHCFISACPFVTHDPSLNSSKPILTSAIIYDKSFFNHTTNENQWKNLGVVRISAFQIGLIQRVL